MRKRLLSAFMAIVFGVLSVGIVNVSAATNTANVINIDLPLDSASELTWIATTNVTVSSANNVGGRYNVLKVDGLANSNNNTAGVKFPDGFSFKEGDVLTYSLDVYSSSAINPDIWIRNHGDGSLAPFAQFSHVQISANTWTTVTKTVTYEEMVSISKSGGSTGEFDRAGNYAIYIRPRSSATVYLDNFTVTVARAVGRKNIIDMYSSLDSASELTWLASDAVIVSEADSIGGRNDVLKVDGLANSNNNTAGLKLPDGFAFEEGDILTYSLDVYSSSAINPDIWLRNHGDSSLAPFAQIGHEQIQTNTWTTVTKTVTYEEMVSRSISGGSNGAFDTAGNYAIYIRPRSNATVYLDNFTVTVSRIDYEGTEPTPTPESHQHTYGDWVADGAVNHKKTCSACSDVVRKAHTWDAGVITTQPTYTSTGIKRYTCTGCDYTKTEVIDKLVPPSQRTTITVGNVTTCAEKGITVPVSISQNAGLMGLTLEIEYDSDVLALTGATKGTALRNLTFTRGAMNENPTTFIWDGSSEDTSNGQILLLAFAIVDTTASEYVVEATVKSACDDKLNTVDTNVTAGTITKKSHSYSSWMKNDNDTHKKVCECGKEITEEHNWNSGSVTTPATHTKDGVRTYTCTICRETKTEVIEKDTENHTYGNFVADGAKNHKKICACGAFTIEAHKWDSGVVTSQPTAGNPGIKTYTCTACKYKRSETFGSRLPTENDTNLTVGNVTARSGDEITVPVSISKNVGLTGLQLTLGYNTDALTLTKVTRGTALGSMEFTEPGDLNGERLVFMWDGQDADNSNGEIVLLDFKVADTAIAGDYQILVNLEIACDQNFNSVPIYLNNGTVKIVNQLPGDVNNDKAVNVMDVMLARRYVAGGHGVVLIESVADVNKDGSVNVMDVMLMRRYVAGGYGVVLK